MKPFLALLLSLVTANAQVSLRGFSSEAAKAQFDHETALKAFPDKARIRGYMARMSESPHHAGSAESKAVAEYAADLLKEWGLNVQIETFEALLPYPTSRLLELNTPIKFKAKLHEPVVAEDKDSGDKGQLPTFNAYSAAGDVSAPLVYANYGLPEDYEVLEKQGIDVKGKIVITRYGKSWRGVKPKVAAEHGAVGCLIYSDPKEDGYFAGDVYPKGPFRPSQGVQRGSVVDMAIYPGDPLSPGWASEKGSKRLTMAEAKTLMKIPVLPISYGDAQPLLEQLQGPVAPETWRGALPLTYHLGPSTVTARLKLEFDNSTRPLYNVIATIPGSELQDQWILYGNHHDAWVNGANDPLSGASSLLETARSFAEFRKTGWQPKRTIKFALWDGEEFGLMGSTEWVEKHAEELQQKAVVYFNSDSNSRGGFGASGSPSLEQFMIEVARDNADPVTGKSLLESPRRRRDGAEPTTFKLGALGSGSDYVAFTHHLGIASLNTGFGGDTGGIYHSVYDSFHWYTTFSDADFAYGQSLSKVMGTALLRLADAPLLPFEFGAMGRTTRAYLDEIKHDAGKNADRLQAQELSTELNRLTTASRDYERALANNRAGWTQASAEKLAGLNRLIYQSERALTLPEGLPGREWYKHQISAPGLYTGYGAKTLPGIREAAEAGRWDEANQQAHSAARAIHAFNERLAEATRVLRSLTD